MSSGTSALLLFEQSVKKVWSSLNTLGDEEAADEQLREMKTRLHAVLCQINSPPMRRQNGIELWRVLCGPLYPTADDGAERAKLVKLEAPTGQPQHQQDVCLLQSLRTLSDKACGVVSSSAVALSRASVLGKSLARSLTIMSEALQSPIAEFTTTAQKLLLWDVSWHILTVSIDLNQHKASQAECLALLRCLVDSADQEAALTPPITSAALKSDGTALRLQRTTVQRTASLCISLLKKKSSSSRMRSLSLHVLGLLCKHYSEFCCGQETEDTSPLSKSVADIFSSVLKELVSLHNVDQMLGEGLTTGLSAYLIGFPSGSHFSSEILSLIVDFVLHGLSTPSLQADEGRQIRNYQLPKALLRFLTMHADCPVLVSLLDQRAEAMISALEKLWSHKNQPVRRATVPAVTAFAHALGYRLSSASLEEQGKRLTKRLLDRFRPLLSSSAPTSRREISFALIMMGHLARAARRCLGDAEVCQLAESLADTIDGWLSQFASVFTPQQTLEPDTAVEGEGNVSDVIYFLSPFAASMAYFLLEVSEISTGVFAAIRKLLDTMLQLLPLEAFFDSLRFAASKAVQKVLMALLEHRCSSHALLVSFVCQRSMDLACGQEPTLAGVELLSNNDEGSDNEEEEVEQRLPLQHYTGVEERRSHTLTVYATFWHNICHVVATDVGYPFEERSREQFLWVIQTELLQAASAILRDVSLTIVVPSGSGVAPASVADILNESVETFPASRQDYEKFLLFVDFYTLLSVPLWMGDETTGSCDDEEAEFARSARWHRSVDFLQLVMQRSRRHPHVAGLLSILYETLSALTVCVGMGALTEGETDQLKQMLSDFFRLCVERCTVFTDDLLYQNSLCLLVIWHTHDVALQRDPRAHPPADLLPLPRISVALQHVLHAVHVAPPSNAEKVNENAMKAEELVEAYLSRHPLKAPLIITAAFFSSQYQQFNRLMYLAARYGIHVTALQSSAPLQHSTWQSQKIQLPLDGEGAERSGLRSVSISPGRLLRRTAHLCLHAEDAASRLAASELFHMLLTWVVGCGPELMELCEEMVAIAVETAATSDSHITKELYTDLLLQCVRWFAFQSATSSRSEGDDATMRILFESLSSEVAEVRRLASRALSERLQYITRMRVLQSSRDGWERCYMAFIDILRSHLALAGVQAAECLSLVQTVLTNMAAQEDHPVYHHEVLMWIDFTLSAVKKTSKSEYVMENVASCIKSGFALLEKAQKTPQQEWSKDRIWLLGEGLLDCCAVVSESEETENDWVPSPLMQSLAAAYRKVAREERERGLDFVSAESQWWVRHLSPPQGPVPPRDDAMHARELPGKMRFCAVWSQCSSSGTYDNGEEGEMQLNSFATLLLHIATVLPYVGRCFSGGCGATGDAVFLLKAIPPFVERLMCVGGNGSMLSETSRSNECTSREPAIDPRAMALLTTSFLFSVEWSQCLAALFFGVPLMETSLPCATSTHSIVSVLYRLTMDVITIIHGNGNSDAATQKFADQFVSAMKSALPDSISEPAALRAAAEIASRSLPSSRTSRVGKKETYNMWCLITPEATPGAQFRESLMHWMAEAVNDDGVWKSEVAAQCVQSSFLLLWRIGVSLADSLALCLPSHTEEPIVLRIAEAAASLFPGATYVVPTFLLAAHNLLHYAITVQKPSGPTDTVSCPPPPLLTINGACRLIDELLTVIFATEGEKQRQEKCSKRLGASEDLQSLNFVFSELLSIPLPDPTAALPSDVQRVVQLKLRLVELLYVSQPPTASGGALFSRSERFTLLSSVASMFTSVCQLSDCQGHLLSNAVQVSRLSRVAFLFSKILSLEVPASERLTALLNTGMQLLQSVTQHELPLFWTELQHSPSYRQYHTVLRAVVCIVSSLLPYKPEAARLLLPIFHQEGYPFLSQLTGHWRAALRWHSGAHAEALQELCTAAIGWQSQPMPSSMWWPASHQMIFPALKCLTPEKREAFFVQHVGQLLSSASLHSPVTDAALRAATNSFDLLQLMASHCSPNAIRGAINDAVAGPSGGTGKELIKKMIDVCRRGVEQERCPSSSVSWLGFYQAAQRCLISLVLATQTQEILFVKLILQCKGNVWSHVVDLSEEHHLTESIPNMWVIDTTVGNDQEMDGDVKGGSLLERLLRADENMTAATQLHRDDRGNRSSHAFSFALSDSRSESFNLTQMTNSDSINDVTNSPQQQRKTQPGMVLADSVWRSANSSLLLKVFDCLIQRTANTNACPEWVKEVISLLTADASSIPLNVKLVILRLVCMRSDFFRHFALHHHFYEAMLSIASDQTPASSSMHPSAFNYMAKEVISTVFHWSQEDNWRLAPIAMQRILPRLVESSIYAAGLFHVPYAEKRAAKTNLHLLKSACETGVEGFPTVSICEDTLGPLFLTAILNPSYSQMVIQVCGVMLQSFPKPATSSLPLTKICGEGAAQQVYSELLKCLSLYVPAAAEVLGMELALLHSGSHVQFGTLLSQCHVALLALLMSSSSLAVKCMRAAAQHCAEIISDELLQTLLIHYNGMDSAVQILALECITLRIPTMPPHLVVSSYDWTHAQFAGKWEQGSEMQRLSESRVALLRLLQAYIPQLPDESYREALAQNFISDSALAFCCTDDDSAKWEFWMLCTSMASSSPSLASFVLQRVRTEKSLAVQDAVLKCTDAHLLSSSFTSRLVELLKSFQPGSSSSSASLAYHQGWLRHAAVLLLNIIRRSPQFTDKEYLFRRPLVENTPVFEKSLESLRGGATRQMTPLFSSTHTMATQRGASILIAPCTQTQRTGEATQRLTESAVLFTLAPTSCSTFSSSIQLPQSSAPLRIKPHLPTWRMSSTTAGMIKAAAAKRSRVAAGKSRRDPAVLYRLYQESDFPPVQQTLEAIVTPLQVLCLYDTEMAELVLSDTMGNVVEQLLSKLPCLSATTSASSLSEVASALYTAMRTFLSSSLHCSGLMTAPPFAYWLTDVWQYALTVRRVVPTGEEEGESEFIALLQRHTAALTQPSTSTSVSHARFLAGTCVEVLEQVISRAPSPALWADLYHAYLQSGKPQLSQVVAQKWMPPEAAKAYRHAKYLESRGAYRQAEAVYTTTLAAGLGEELEESTHLSSHLRLLQQRAVHMILKWDEVDCSVMSGEAGKVGALELTSLAAAAALRRDVDVVKTVLLQQVRAGDNRIPCFETAVALLWTDTPEVTSSFSSRSLTQTLTEAYSSLDFQSSFQQAYRLAMVLDASDALRRCSEQVDAGESEEDKAATIASFLRNNSNSFALPPTTDDTPHVSARLVDDTLLLHRVVMKKLEAMKWITSPTVLKDLGTTNQTTQLALCMKAVLLLQDKCLGNECAKSFLTDAAVRCGGTQDQLKVSALRTRFFDVAYRHGVDTSDDCVRSVEAVKAAVALLHQLRDVVAKGTTPPERVLLSSELARAEVTLLADQPSVSLLSDADGSLFAHSFFGAVTADLESSSAVLTAFDSLLTLTSSGETSAEVEDNTSDELWLLYIRCLLHQLRREGKAVASNGVHHIPRLWQALRRPCSQNNVQWVTTVRELFGEGETSMSLPLTLWLPWTCQMVYTLLATGNPVLLTALKKMLYLEPRVVYCPLHAEMDSLLRMSEEGPLKAEVSELVNLLLSDETLRPHRLLCEYLFQTHDVDQRCAVWESRVKSEVKRQRTGRLKELLAEWYADCISTSQRSRTEPLNFSFATEMEKAQLPFWSLADGRDPSQWSPEEWQSALQRCAEVRRGWVKDHQSLYKTNYALPEVSNALHQLLHGLSGPTQSTAAKGRFVPLPVQPLLMLNQPFRDECVTGSTGWVSVLSSKQRPKVLQLVTTQRMAYKVLVKGGDDLRQDQRIQDIFQVFNLLMSLSGRRDARRTLLRTYSVIPVSKYVGVVEFLPHTSTMMDVTVSSMLREQQQQQQQDDESHPSNGSGGFRIQQAAAGKSHIDWRSLPWYVTYLSRYSSIDKYAAASHHPPPDLTEWFGGIVSSIRPNYLSDALQRISPSASHWHTVKHQFLQSHSTLAMIGYLFGIGDRHMSNFLVDLNDGTLIGIDFGFAFDSTVRYQAIPELVPFRHTPQIQHVQGVVGNAACATLMHGSISFLRRHRNVFDAVSSAFADAPMGNEIPPAGVAEDKYAKKLGEYKLRLLRWKLHQLRNPRDVLYHSVKQRQDVAASPTLKAGLKQLIYQNSQEGQQQMGQIYFDETAAYVKELISLSTDPNLLGRMWINWFPCL